MNDAKETWLVEIGNDAQLLRTLTVFGTEYAAVRVAKAELRRGLEGEHCADVLRPGCRVARSIKSEQV